MENFKTCRSYWGETCKPLVNLAFVAPMLIAYEGGLILYGPQVMRNGADVWLRRLLEWIGFSQYFLLPVITCGLLLGWHHVTRQSWKLRGSVLYGMLFESLAFGAVLLAVAHLHRSLLAIEVPASIDSLNAVHSAVAFLGAGIYEELVFRLGLLSALAATIHRLGVSRIRGLVTAITVSSLVFAAAHYRIDLPWITFSGEPFIWSTFLFRFAAGVMFSVLFLFRGFGIAVGAHAIYDILVGC